MYEELPEQTVMVCGCKRDWRRVNEAPLFGVVPFIGEFWNTVSNACFVMFGILRLVECFGLNQRVGIVLYSLYIIAGFASAFHHASPLEWRNWTIVVDWLPIVSSALVIIFWPECWPMLHHIRIISWFQLALAFAVLRLSVHCQ